MITAVGEGEGTWMPAEFGSICMDKLELFVIIYEDNNYIISKFAGIVWLNDF